MPNSKKKFRTKITTPYITEKGKSKMRRKDKIIGIKKAKFTNSLKKQSLNDSH